MSRINYAQCSKYHALIDLAFLLIFVREMHSMHVYKQYAYGYTDLYIISLPFSLQAMQAKYEGDYARTLSLGTRALCFNIIGGFVHVLFLGVLTFLPILLKFVFDVI